MIKIKKEEIASILGNSCKAIGVTYKRELKHDGFNLIKTSEINGMINASYTALQNRKRVKEGLPADFTPKKNNAGEHLTNGVLINKDKGKTYLWVKPNKSKSKLTFKNGRPCNFNVESKSAEFVLLDMDKVKEIRFNKKTYKVI